MGYSFAEVLNRRRGDGGRTNAQTTSPAGEGIEPRRAARRPGEQRGGSASEQKRRPPVARRPSRRVPSPATRPAAPASPPPRRALSDRELYQTWLRLTLVPDTPAIVEWPNVYLAARGLGLTRLGRGDYQPEQWRKAVQRLVREGGAIPFWWRTRGRPPRVLTTQQHLAAWAIAGYHLRLGRRRRA